MTTEHTCGECGESFGSPQAASAHKGQKHSAEYKDAETLRELYHEKDMSTIEIAEKFDVDPSTVSRNMKREGIELDKAYHDTTRPPSHTLDMTGEGVGNSYEIVRSYHNGTRQMVYIHRLVAYAHRKLDFDELCDSDTVVHHESGHGLDNRPDNLTVKSFKDHATDHADERYNGGWRDKERLKELLQQTTQKEAAEILGCSKKTIYVWKNRHGLE